MFNIGKKRRAKPTKTLFQRAVRSVVTVVVLTAFVLGLSLSVKKLASLQTNEIIKLAEPVLVKIGISSEKASAVAGDVSKRITSTSIAPSVNYEATQRENLSDSVEESVSATQREVLLKVAVMSDAENNADNLSRALATAKNSGAQMIFFLGDYTSLGELSDLKSMKSIMDASGLTYYSLPGDRDLYDTVGPANFISVFGTPQRSVSIGSTKFVLVDNSANFSTIDTDIVGQYTTEISDADFVLMSQPLYHPLASYGKPVMGLVQGELVKEVKEQADTLVNAIQLSNVSAVIAGDHHSFSKYKDQKRQSLEHITLGAITSERSDQGKASISILSVFVDGAYSVDEITF